MTKMAAMPIYGKNLKKSSSPEPKSQWPWNLVCSIGCLSTTKFVLMMTLCWPWPILRQGQICSLVLFYGKKAKQWILQKLLLSMIWNYQQMTEVTRSFYWHQNFVPWGGCMPPASGLYTCIKPWKKLYKIRFQHTFDLSRSGVKLPIWRLLLCPPDEAAKIPIFMNFDFSLFPKAKTCFPITADACFI